MAEGVAGREVDPDAWFWFGRGIGDEEEFVVGVDGCEMPVASCEDRSVHGGTEARGSRWRWRRLLVGCHEALSHCCWAEGLSTM